MPRQLYKKHNTETLKGTDAGRRYGYSVGQRPTRLSANLRVLWTLLNFSTKRLRSCSSAVCVDINCEILVGLKAVYPRLTIRLESRPA